MGRPRPRRNTRSRTPLLAAARPSIDVLLGALLTGSSLLLLTGCTERAVRTSTTPVPTVTVTVTVTTGPGPSAATAGPSPSTAAVLQPQVHDRADLAYRSGTSTSGTQFTVPASGYEILYLCRTDGTGNARVDRSSAGLHASGAGSPSDTTLHCDDAVHTITVDAATVRRTGRAGTVRKLSLTGDRQDVLSIDLSVRALE